MRTTLDLPDGLLEDVRRNGGFPTKRAAVLAALEEYLRGRRREHLVATLGTHRISLTHEDLAEMRGGYRSPALDAALAAGACASEGA
jgi:Arc/MetJ family transcription regulator